MVHFRVFLIMAVLSIALLLSACSSSDSSETSAESEPAAEAAAESEAAEEEVEAEEEAVPDEEGAAEEEATEDETAAEDEEAADEEEVATEEESAAEEEATEEEAAAEDEEAADEEEDTEEEVVSEEPLAEIDHDNFSDPTTIDNEWNPMAPGTHWVHEGTTIEDGESIPRRIEFTVTDLTKEVDGITTVVAWIVDYADDEVVEKEIAFYAQDNDGTIWYLGEYPAEYEEGEFIEANPWLAGVESGKAGIAMQADPQADTPSYSQGWSVEAEWSDRGIVFATGEETCVAFDCYEDVLIIDEYNMEEPGAFQQKYYARGVGNVQVGFRGDDPDQEELELVEFRQLTGEELAEIRELALALEAEAYEISPDMYGQSEPAE